MATGEIPPVQDSTPRAHRPRTQAGRAGAGALVALALALALALSLLVIHVATRHGPARTLYIALGDSYTAGPGIPAQLDAPSGCGRSSRSYPVLVARHLGLHPGQYRDASCSGARIASLTAPQSTGRATNPPQLSVLSADATLVTVGIGGNDLGFTGILTRCVERDALGALIAADLFRTADDHAPCRTSYVSGGTDEIRQKIRAVSAALAPALRRIRDLAPRARVLVVGYPDLLPASGGIACARALGLTAGDVAFLNEEELQLNRMLRSQAAAAGDGYVDAYTPSAGHDACAAPAARWIEPLITAPPAVPMHPNAAGQRAMASAVERAIARS